MTTDEFDSALGDLETRVDRLRALYENWFRGYEKTEPSVARKEVERRVYALRKELPRNTALRFRYHQLYLRYTSLATYWQRTARQIEDGTHKLQLQRLRRRNQRSEERAEEREERREEAGPRHYELDLDESLNVDDLLDDLEIEEVARALDAPGPHSEPPPALRPAPRPAVSRSFARQKREESLPSLPPVALDEELQRPRPAAAQQRSPAAGASQFPDFEPPTALRNQPLDLRAPAVPRREPLPSAARAAPQAPGSDALSRGARRELPAPPGTAGTPAASAPGANAPAVPSLGNRAVPAGKGPLPAPPRTEGPVTGPLPGVPVAPRQPARPALGPPGINAATPPGAAPRNPPATPAAARPPPAASGATAMGRPAPAAPSGTAMGRPAPAAPSGTAAGRPAPAAPSGTAAGRPAPAAPGGTAMGRPAPASPGATGAGRPAPATSPGAGRPAPAAPGPTAAGARPVPIVNGDTIVGRPPMSSPIAPAVSSAPNEQRMRRIYDEYAAARRRNNEGEVRYEAMVNSIQRMLPELAKKHQGRSIDFEVVVKDGRVGLKPKAT